MAKIGLETKGWSRPRKKNIKVNKKTEKRLKLQKQKKLINRKKAEVIQETEKICQVKKLKKSWNRKAKISQETKSTKSKKN